MGRVWAAPGQLWCRLEVWLEPSRAGARCAEAGWGPVAGLRRSPKQSAVGITGVALQCLLTASASDTQAAFGGRLGALRHDLLRPARHGASSAGSPRQATLMARPPG